MRITLLLLLAAICFGQPPVPIPSEWKRLDPTDVMQRMESAGWPKSLWVQAVLSLYPEASGWPHGERVAYMQKVATSAAQAGKVRPARFHMWMASDKQRCDHMLVDGRPIRIFAQYPLLIFVSVMEDGPNAAAAIRVYMAENFNGKMDIAPWNFRMAHVGKDVKVEKSLNPASIAKRAISSAKWQGFFAGLGSQMATQQVRIQSNTTLSSQQQGSGVVGVNPSVPYAWQATSTGTASTTTTVTAPDYAARARADAYARQRMAQAQAQAQTVFDAALKGNTLTPGKEVQGVVWFKNDKNAKSSVLSLSIEGTDFEFPYVRDKK